nr:MULTISPECIES: hypothetical protein [unclassified Massilia]
MLDLLEYLIAYASLCQAITEQPDRLGVGDAAAFRQIQETQEAAAVQQLVLQRVVGQVVELLQHQNPDHQDRRVRRTAALGARRTRRGGIDARRQRLEIHVLGQAHQRIAQLCSPVLTLLLGKQTDPGFHHDGTRWLGSMPGFYSAAGISAEVFRGGPKATLLFSDKVCYFS